MEKETPSKTPAPEKDSFGNPIQGKSVTTNPAGSFQTAPTKKDPHPGLTQAEFDSLPIRG